MTDESTRLWTALALTTLRLLAATKKAFSTDDVWLALDELPKPDDPRALGPILRQAKDERLIEKTDFTVTSQRAVCHARPVAVWRSVPLRATDADAAEYVANKKTRLTAPTLPLLDFGTPTPV